MLISTVAIFATFTRLWIMDMDYGLWIYNLLLYTCNAPTNLHDLNRQRKHNLIMWVMAHK